MRPFRRRILLAALLGGSIEAHATGTGTALPPGPIRIVVAYPPGGISDLIMRLLADRMALLLGAPVRVENQAGAGGAIALRALARAVPDGRTLAFSAITPLSLDAQQPAGVRPALAPVASVMLTPSLLVGTPAFRGQRFEDLLRSARARPGSLRWATSGIATTGHLVLQQICRSFDIAVTHVPYKGGAQQLTDALGGQFELLATNVGPTQLRYVRGGRFKALAVGAPARLDVLPELPTLAELGCPRANLASLFGLFAPGGTPSALVRKLNDAVNEALRQPALRAALLGAGNLPTGGSAQAFATAIERATEDIAALLKRE